MSLVLGYQTSFPLYEPCPKVLASSLIYAMNCTMFVAHLKFQMTHVLAKLVMFKTVKVLTLPLIIIAYLLCWLSIVFPREVPGRVSIIIQTSIGVRARAHSFQNNVSV